MGTLDIDQIVSDGSVVQDVDSTLSEDRKNQLLLEALPEGAEAEVYAGVRIVRFRDQLIFKKQITHMGFPHPEFKKRIQIPNSWVAAHQQAVHDGLRPRFVGIYHYHDVTIFVDYDPRTYARNKANNSSAWVYTNDLFQAQTLGQFSREDQNGNCITTVRTDQFESYLRSGFKEKNPHIEVLDNFSETFLDGTRINGLTAVQEMHAASWPDSFQNEWAGFYVEFRLSHYLAKNNLTDRVIVQKEKRKSEFDYDLRFLNSGMVEHFGDLKASSIAVNDSPGNDKETFLRCLEQYGRFWYVIYEHETWHARDNGNLATIEWNDWRRSVGHVGRSKTYDSRSYAGRFKEAVRFMRVRVLEVNQANVSVVLKDFQKDFRQPDGKPRKVKVSIKKKDIDNFLIYTKSLGVPTA